jgi:hypothetical protein
MTLIIPARGAGRLFMIRPRFRIRTLFIAVALAALALGWAMRPYPDRLGRANTKASQVWIVRWTGGSRYDILLSDRKTPVPRKWDMGQWLVTITWSDGSRSYYLRKDIAMPYGDAP